jgi:hypothetical protein
MLTRQKDTSAGFPWYVHRDAALFDYLPNSDEWIENNQEKAAKAYSVYEKLEGMADPVASCDDIIAGKRLEAPLYTANFRTEAGGDKPKLRLVWSAPMDNQLLEAKTAVVIQSSLKYDTPEEDKRMGSMFMYCNEYLQMVFLRNMMVHGQKIGNDVISADYSAFDSTISSELIRLAFDILLGDSDLARLTADRFVNKQLISPWGTKEVVGMVPSGSVFTNLIDAVVNAMNIEYIAERLHIDVAYRINGDDSVALFSKRVTEPQLEEYSSELGIVMNPNKQTRSEDSCHFNKSYWGFEYEGPVPSVNRVINSLVHRDSMLERPKGANEECVRSIQVLQRLEYHPWRDDVLKLMYEQSFLSDGHSALDYRWRLPKSMIQSIIDDDVEIDMSRYVAKLDSTFWAKIYD